MQRVSMLGLLFLVAACGDTQKAVPTVPRLERIDRVASGAVEKFDVGVWVWRFDLPQPCVATARLDIYTRGAQEPVSFRHVSGVGQGEATFSFAFREPDSTPEREAFLEWTNVRPGAENVGDGEPGPMKARFGYHVSASTYGVTQTWWDPFEPSIRTLSVWEPELVMGNDLPLVQLCWGGNPGVGQDARLAAKDCDRVYKLTIRFEQR